MPETRNDNPTRVFTKNSNVTHTPEKRRLVDYQNREYKPGRGFVVRTIWYYVSLLLMENGWLPFSGLKVAVLRLFGSTIGNNVVIRPNVRVKYPWRLTVGDHCWIGQEVWIDNLDHVRIGQDVCISQGAYLCTGSHDHRSETFDLKTAPIVVHDGAWICCRATVLAGATVEPMEVVSAGTVFSARKADDSVLETATERVARKPR